MVRNLSAAFWVVINEAVYIASSVSVLPVAFLTIAALAVHYPPEVKCQTSANNLLPHPVPLKRRGFTDPL